MRDGQEQRRWRRGWEPEWEWEGEGGDMVGVKREVEGRIPREGIEKVLGDAVVGQAVGREEKAPGGSWPGDLVRAWREDPGWEGVNRGF